MKKSLFWLCLGLTLALLTAVLALGVFASDGIRSEIKAIAVVEGSVGTIIENDGGYWTTGYDPETSEFKPIFYYRYEEAWKNAEVELTFADGHKEIVDFLHNEYDLNFGVEDNQLNDFWTVGGENKVRLYLDTPAETLFADYNMVITESPLEKIEVVEGTEVKLVENYYGEWKEYFDEETQTTKSFFQYDTHPLVRGLEFKLTFKNGEVKTGGLWDEINGYSFGWEEDQWENNWVRGGNNIFKVFIMGKTLEMNIEIDDTPVEKIEVIGDKKIFTEGQECDILDYTDSTTGEKVEYTYYYEYNALENTQLKVTYKDGSSEQFSTVNGGRAFDVAWDGNQMLDPWEVGGDNFIKVTYMGVSTDVKVELRENPVKKIEAVDESITPLIENVHGHQSVRYNEETQCDEMFFCYEIGYALSTVKFKVTYSNGNEDIVDVYGMGYSAEWLQHQKPWGIGVHPVALGVRIPDGSGVPEQEISVPVTVNITVIENPIEKIELKEAPIKFIYENTNGSFEEVFDQESGETKKVFIYDYTRLLDGAVFILTYKDGTTEEYTFRFEDDTQFFDSWANQEQNPWSVGDNNPFTVKYMGKEVELYATIVPNPVEKIEVVKETMLPLYQNCDGEWDYYWDEETGSGVNYFKYDCHLALVNAELKVFYTDGTYKVFMTDYIEVESKQYVKPWNVGENTALVGFMLPDIGIVWTEVTFTVVESPVESIEVVENTVKSLIENSGGYTEWYYDEETGEEKQFYCYNLDRVLEPIYVKIKFKDGTSKTVNLYDEVDGRHMRWSDNQQDEPWTVGGNNTVRLFFMGAETSINIPVEVSPVASIEVIESTLTPFVEFVNCEINWWYDEETGEENEYYWYGYENALDKAKIKVNYKNGDSEYIYYRFRNEQQVFNVFSNQGPDNPWTVGGDNKITVEYMGASDTVPVVITPNPVEKIEVVKGTLLPLIKDAGGYMDWWYDEEKGKEVEFFCYDVDGIVRNAKIKIYFKDGTTKIIKGDESLDGYFFNWYTNQYEKPWHLGGEKIIYLQFMGIQTEVAAEMIDCPLESFTVTHADFGRYIYGDPESGYMTEKGFVLYTHIGALSFNVKYKDGRTVEYSLDEEYGWNSSYGGYGFYITPKEEYAVIGKNTFILEYMGMQVEYEVDVLESPVEYIKVIKAPNKTDYVEGRSVNYSHYKFNPVFDGIDFEVKFKDGRVIKVSEHTEDTYYDYSAYCMKVDGEMLYIVTDENGINAYYLGATCSVDCITYTEEKTIADIKVKNFSKDVDGTVITIIYTDGTSEEVTLEVLTIYDTYDPWYADGLALCSKGVIEYYMIDAEIDNIYAVNVFGITALVTYESDMLTGDADGNGTVDSDDAIHLLYHVLFGDAYQLTQECDFDGSGTVDSDDAIHLLYHVLFGADSYPLKG